MRFCEGENAEVVQKKLVKACRNLSLSESMRSFPVCSLQLTVSSRSSTPCLPPSPSQSHLSSVSLPPLNLSDAVGPGLTLLPLWWFFLSFPVLLTMFTYSTFFHVLVSPLSAVYKWQQGNALIWPFLAAAPLGPHSSNPLYFVILIWAQIIITCNICTISIHITLSTGSRLIYRLAWMARLLAESGTPCSFHFLISHLFIHPLTVLCRCTAHTNGEEVSCKSNSVKRKKAVNLWDSVYLHVDPLSRIYMLTGVRAHTAHCVTLPWFAAPPFISQASICLSPRSRLWGKNPGSAHKWEERQVVWAVWSCDFAVSLWSATVWILLLQL